MNGYRLSRAADRDIETIARSSIARFGWAQTQDYLTELDQAFALLARFPGLGRRIDHIRPGYLRFEHGSHVIFFRQSEDHILIARVLHHRMQPQGRV